MMTHKRSITGSWSFLWKLTILGIALIVNVTLGVRLFSGQQSLSNYHHLKKQQTVLQEQIDAQDAINASLSREIRLLQADQRYVEKKIRQRLNYVKERELLYLFDEGHKVNTGANGHAGKN